MITCKLSKNIWLLKINGKVYSNPSLIALIKEAEKNNLLYIERINLLPKVIH